VCVPNRLGMKDWIVLETQEDAYNMRVVAGKSVQPEGPFGIQCRMMRFQEQQNNLPHSDFTVDNHTGIR